MDLAAPALGDVRTALITELALPGAGAERFEQRRGQAGGVRANRGDGHGLARDIEMQFLRDQAIVRLQARLAVCGSGQGLRQVDTIAIEQHLGFVKFHGG